MHIPVSIPYEYWHHRGFRVNNWCGIFFSQEAIDMKGFVCLIVVTALSFLQCVDNVSSVAGKTSGP